MKKLILAGAVAFLMGQAAFATVSLKLVSGASTTIVTGGAGSVIYSNPAFNNWNVTLAFGSSKSPTIVPYGIDLTSLTAACNSGICSELDIYLSDTNFDIASPSFKNSFSTTILAGTGSATQKAWVDTSNTLFGTPGGGYIGQVGPLTVTGGGSVSGAGPAGPGNYSLTLEQIFTDRGGATFSSDGGITGVPEPASVALLGGVVVLVARTMRRKFARS